MNPCLMNARWPAVAVFALLLALPRPGAGEGARVIIGGALDPDNERVYGEILGRRLPGRPICVLPTASSRPKRSMRAYLQDFERYGGAGVATGFKITTKRSRRAMDARVAARLDECGGFFFTGGDQSRIVDVFRPAGESTPADEALRRVVAAGGVVAGTSAGAAMMSDPMIGGGGSGDAFEHGVTSAEDSLGVWVRGGMGFLPAALVDQHCLARGRLGRLMVAVAARSEARRGLCIDEDTALVAEGEIARVVGVSGVAFLDLEGATPASAGFRRGRLWLLGDGDRLDLAAGSAEPAAGKEARQPGGPVELPEAPWHDDSLHRFLVAFAGSAETAAELGSGRSRFVLRKTDGFRAVVRRSEAGSEIAGAATFAGPFEIDWLPGVADGLESTDER